MGDTVYLIHDNKVEYFKVKSIMTTSDEEGLKISYRLKASRNSYENIIRRESCLGETMFKTKIELINNL